MGLEDIGLVGRNKGFSKETPLPKRTDRNDRGCEGEREDWHTALPTKSSKKKKGGRTKHNLGRGCCAQVSPQPRSVLCVATLEGKKATNVPHLAASTGGPADSFPKRPLALRLLIEWRRRYFKHSSTSATTPRSICATAGPFLFSPQSL